MGFEWQCEDMEEARGLASTLEASGVVVHWDHADPARPRLLAHGEEGERAAALCSSILQSHARRAQGEGRMASRGFALRSRVALLGLGFGLGASLLWAYLRLA